MEHNGMDSEPRRVSRNTIRDVETLPRKEVCNAREQKGKKWVKRHQWRMPACHNHHNGLDSTGSWSKKFSESLISHANASAEDKGSDGGTVAAAEH
ncbi:hypothetical protein HAX54_041449 [Datura stramonium]|uniref:Uncharacterized protein n=1 Tax=Datura stramonium TaxID=4076 RepID=A0ABS8VP56_DATST|nr:hypothetical protein [Datura stramonium]